MKFFDVSNPKAIVSSDGIIQLFNSTFDQMFKDQFKLKQMPQNLLRFVHNDPDVSSKLQQIVQMHTKPFHRMPS